MPWAGRVEVTRTKLATDRRRSAPIIAIRCSPNERAILARAAKSVGRPLARWVREVAICAARLVREISECDSGE